MDAGLKIALIEDNDDLRDLLEREIARAGYFVQSADCAEGLDELAADAAFDLLVLDLNLPGEDGLSIARRYKRASPGLHVIMVTARTRIEDKVAGYESGADIYLTKPVASSELMAAIGSVAKRLDQHNHGVDLTLNVRTMSLRGATSTELSRQEVLILKALGESPQGNLPYYRLIELCGDEDVGESSKSALEVRIARLRKKLADVGVAGRSIRAIRGEGYQLLRRIRIE